MTDKELREKTGLSVAEVAKLEGKTRDTIYKWERDNHYSETLRVKLRAIIGGKPEVLNEINKMEHLKLSTAKFLKNIDERLNKLWKEAIK